MDRIGLWVLLGLAALFVRPSFAKIYRFRREHTPIPAGSLIHAVFGLGTILTVGLALLVPAPLVWKVLTGGVLILVGAQAVVRELRVDQS